MVSSWRRADKDACRGAASGLAGISAGIKSPNLRYDHNRPVALRAASRRHQSKRAFMQLKPVGYIRGYSGATLP